MVASALHGRNWRESMSLLPARFILGRAKDIIQIQLLQTEMSDGNPSFQIGVFPELSCDTEMFLLLSRS